MISRELVEDDTYTSIHIEEYECDARDTKLGPRGNYKRHSQCKRKDQLKDLDEYRIVRVGAKFVQVIF